VAKPPKSPAPFPSREKILEFIQNTPGNVGKREIARAFHLDSEQKRELKKLLRELTLHGSLQKGRGRNYTGPGELPEVTTLDIAAIDDAGELIARPVNWNAAETRPLIVMAPERRGQPALGIGDRVLARLTKIGEHNYKAKTIRRIAAAPPTVLGIFDMIDGSARIRPTDKRARSDFIVQVGDEMHAQPGELVRAEVPSGRRLGLRQAKVIERLDKFAGTKAISLISIHEHGIPDRFSNDTVAAAEAAGPAPLDKRVDLRDLPLVTIDGADARDFDDAVWAEPDPDGTSWSRSPTFPGMSARQPRSIWTPMIAGIRFISPIGSCRCCRKRCRTGCVRLYRTKTAAVWPSICGSTPTATCAGTNLSAALCARPRV